MFCVLGDGLAPQRMTIAILCYLISTMVIKMCYSGFKIELTTYSWPTPKRKKKKKKSTFLPFMRYLITISEK